jgi:hypothetical protein
MQAANFDHLKSTLEDCVARLAEERQQAEAKREDAAKVIAELKCHFRECVHKLESKLAEREQDAARQRELEQEAARQREQETVRQACSLLSSVWWKVVDICTARLMLLMKPWQLVGAELAASASALHSGFANKRNRGNSGYIHVQPTDPGRGVEDEEAIASASGRIFWLVEKTARAVVMVLLVGMAVSMHIVGLPRSLLGAAWTLILLSNWLGCLPVMALGRTKRLLLNILVPMPLGPRREPPLPILASWSNAFTSLVFSDDWNQLVSAFHDDLIRLIALNLAELALAFGCIIALRLLGLTTKLGSALRWARRLAAKVATAGSRRLRNAMPASPCRDSTDEALCPV